MVVASVLDVNPFRDRVADSIALVYVLERNLRPRRLAGDDVEWDSDRAAVPGSEPKSACSPVSSPIERIRVAEFAATGSLSTRRFHGFELGKTVQCGAAGNRRAAAEPDKAATRSAVEKTGTARIRSLYRCYWRCALSFALCARFMAW